MYTADVVDWGELNGMEDVLFYAIEQPMLSLKAGPLLMLDVVHLH